MPNYIITESTKEESELFWKGIIEYENERGALEHDNKRGLTKGIEVRINRTIKCELNKLAPEIIN